MTPEIREIKIEYVSGKTSPPIPIEIFRTSTDVEIQLKEPAKKGKKRFATDGVYALGETEDEAWTLFKKYLGKRITNQDPEKIYIV